MMEFIFYLTLLINIGCDPIQVLGSPIKNGCYLFIPSNWLKEAPGTPISDLKLKAVDSYFPSLTYWCPAITGLVRFTGTEMELPIAFTPPQWTGVTLSREHTKMPC